HRFTAHAAACIPHGDRKTDGNAETGNLTFEGGYEEPAEFEVALLIYNTESDHDDSRANKWAELDGHRSAVLKSHVKSRPAGLIRTALQKEMSASAVWCESDEKGRLRRGKANSHGTPSAVERHFTVRVEIHPENGEIANLDIPERQPIAGLD